MHPKTLHDLDSRTLLVWKQVGPPGPGSRVHDLEVSMLMASSSRGQVRPCSRLQVVWGCRSRLGVRAGVTSFVRMHMALRLPAGCWRQGRLGGEQPGRTG